MTDARSRIPSPGARDRLLLVTASAAALTLLLSGCDTALPLLVGEQKQSQAAPLPVPPAPPSTVAYAPNSMDSIAPQFGTQSTILPPTLPRPPEDGAPEGPSISGQTARRPIASAALTTDPAALAPLAKAAAAQSANVRFLLLAVAPQASDTATLQQNAAQSREATDAAIQAMGGAGIDAARIEVAAAAAPAGNGGELRLYLR